MNRAKTFVTSVSLAVLLLFGLTVPAHAITTLTSTPLFLTSGQLMVCAITNVGPHPITVTFQVINFLGFVLDTSDRTVVSGGFDIGVLDGPAFAYCKFTGNFNRGFVRASAQLVQPGGPTLLVVPAQAVGE